MTSTQLDVYKTETNAKFGSVESKLDALESKLDSLQRDGRADRAELKAEITSILRIFIQDRMQDKIAPKSDYIVFLVKHA